ncbi:28S ribosomal protein S23, mitochondrial-like [Uranotaenia lowii]|uniref:28S ribosomal protein S23, mitochondrial-like n=1 Tax=Uranotaenia lowii TaxID=190385 RepID=UPI00247B1F11|nr:28S ribosomal protein S23, mitochondrial-like [Uranotaenia lowii]
MAQSRLEKIGTIVTRTEGLLRAGAMKWDERPLWYDVVKAFPPKEEPRFDRPAPNVKVRPIFYAEDKIRAKYYKHSSAQYMVNMADTKTKTPSQHFVEIYQKLGTQGALDEGRVFETAQELLGERLKELKLERITVGKTPAPKASSSSPVTSTSDPVEKGKLVDMQDIFKD